MRLVAVLFALAACRAAHPSYVPPVGDPALATVGAAGCAALLRARFAIDTAPEPRICVPLAQALAPLGPRARAAVHGMRIVRGGRGRCGDACPDLAATLMSDAALAYYHMSDHTLVVTDATFDGPRWRGGTPSRAAVDAYLAALGLDWPGLVARLHLPPAPFGDPAVFDAIVRRGPRVLLGGDVELVDLLRHELGHAVQLHQSNQSYWIRLWSSATGWREPAGREVADGYVGGMFANERPIVASRLLLGLPRGDSDYAPRVAGPTGYADFDPIEDFGEAFRLVHQDPVRLGERSPVRLLIASADEVPLTGPLRRFIAPGVRALLADDVDAEAAMRVIRAHGAELLPEIAPFADPRPLPLPADLDPEVRAIVDDAQLVVELDGLRFRPSDAAVRAFVARTDQEVRDMREFNRSMGQ